jgi:hypothetical protein
MIYTASYVMVLMRADPLRGQVGGGLGPGNRDFFGPCEMASSRYRRVPFGAQKSLDIQGSCPHTVYLFDCMECSYDPTEGHPRQHAYTFVIRILSTLSPQFKISY